MKKIKILCSLLLVIFTFIKCEQDDNNVNIDAIEAPTNVAALFNITQDNTGLVTITPLGEGVAEFDIDFGDASAIAEGINPGNNVEHTYAEGTYDVVITAYALNGLATVITQQLVVSFLAPQNLMVTIENDLAVSKQVNVTATADYAVSFEVDFGDGSPILSANIGDTISYIYANPGTYTITVTAMGGAIQTTTYSEDFVVTAIVQPLTAAPTPPSRLPQDVISIFSAAYTNLANPDYFPDWGQGGQGSSWAMFNLAGDDMLQYINLSYQGIDFGEQIDATNMEFLHLDVWTADVVTDLEVSAIRPGPQENAVTIPLGADQWTSIDIPLTDYTNQGLTIADLFQLKFVGTPWAAGTVFIDNIYFYKAASAAQTLEGTWRIAPEAGALGVGPAPGDTSWWNCDATCVTDRACYYDDTYVFNANGTFANVLGADTWTEGWQGGGDSCGTPIAPHDGSAAATYVYDAGANTVTINGAGAYIGIPKANNQGELPAVAVPSSITYDVTFIDPNTISVMIESGTGSGVFWQYKLIKDSATSPLEGTWQIAPEAGALGVGPAPGDTSWWNCDAICVTDRACYYDDTFVFGASGSFSNVLGTDTWIEGWQGGSDSCGTPVAPHDGSAVATYTYDAGASTITINGAGAYIGIPKANNQGELPAVAVPSSITYDVTFIDASTINVIIESGTGSGVFWQYKLIKI